MLQVFRLVSVGHVDQMIAFENIPDDLLKGIRRGGIEGLPRYWRKWFGIDDVEPNPSPFFILDYEMVNKDKEKWQEISHYVRKNADKNVRLLDKLIDMAAPMAPNIKAQMTLEPEDIPIIRLPKVIVGKPAEAEKELKPFVVPPKNDERVIKKRPGLSDERKLKLKEARDKYFAERRAKKMAELKT